MKIKNIVTNIERHGLDQDYRKLVTAEADRYFWSVNQTPTFVERELLIDSMANAVIHGFHTALNKLKEYE